jgi:hypothetical protein
MKITAYYPGNSLNTMISLRNPRWEDFDYTYREELLSNPMCWLGNGYTVADYDGSSKTRYLDTANIDYPPVPESASLSCDKNDHTINGYTTNGLPQVGILQAST